MYFVFRKLQQENALIIADEWKYDAPYSFYDMSADVDDYSEFINESIRNEGNYYEAFINNELVGFFTLLIDDTEIEIGLGLKPNYCGKGIGKDFLNQIIEYVNENYVYDVLSMSVASFNERAIKVYQAAGFIKQNTFIQETNGGEYEFTKLIKQHKKTLVN